YRSALGFANLSGGEAGDHSARVVHGQVGTKQQSSGAPALSDVLNSAVLPAGAQIEAQVGQRLQQRIDDAVFFQSGRNDDQRQAGKRVPQLIHRSPVGAILED